MTAREIAEDMYRDILHEAADPFAACLKYATLAQDLREVLWRVPNELQDEIAKLQRACLHDKPHDHDLLRLLKALTIASESVLARADEILRQP